MKDMAAELVARLNVDTAFTIPIFGGIQIAESVVISWVVMAVLVLLSLILTSGMKVWNPGKRQVLAETAVNWLDGFTKDMLGPDAT